MLAPRVLGLLACSYFGLASAANQLSMGGVPSCAISCTLQSLPQSNCSALDQACLCADTKLAAAVEPCIRSQCTIKESLAAANASYSQCGITPRDESAAIRWTGSVVTGLAILFMAMRLVAKIAKISVWGADDTAAVAAFVVHIAIYAQSFYALDVGLGRDIWTLHDYQITSFLKLFLFLEFFYLVELALVKASILFFFLKIFPGRGIRRCLWSVQIMNLLVCLSFTVLIFAQCRPFSYFWTRWDGEHKGVCVDLSKLGLVHVGLNIALDIVMLVLPVTQVYHLKMDMRKKIGVIAMFQAGIFLTIASVLRIKTLTTFSMSLNLTADSVDVAIWGYIETGVGVIVACMPSASQLLKRIPSKVTQLTTAMASNKGSSGNRTSPESRVFPYKPATASLTEAQLLSSNSIAMLAGPSSRRPSVHYYESKTGSAL
ncbi:integral membrane protein [Colletotrichum zoysiae]|uniref:Integral membrane protein n=1 Tax=Colletotrichum zoysiae TaxID=1216348 RepID=A0AAD9M5G1_9PEZI|nr:integral membrane protein [Colletotrichum zoysiae]